MTNEIKHTPGPWTYEVFVDNRRLGSDHHTYKVTPQRGVYGSLFEDDARLIAAAPDLLEAAKEVYEWMNELPVPTDGCTSKMQRLFDAIAKAEGRA